MNLPFIYKNLIILSLLKIVTLKVQTVMQILKFRYTCLNPYKHITLKIPHSQF